MAIFSLFSLISTLVLNGPEPYEPRLASTLAMHFLSAIHQIAFFCFLFREVAE